jgi:hypothetical protein
VPEEYVNLIGYDDTNFLLLAGSMLYKKFYRLPLLGRERIVSVDVVSSDILSRNRKNVTMQDQSRERTQ